MTTATPATAAASTGVRIGPRGVPPLTIGYQGASWAMRYLEQPDGPRAGEPWRYTAEQLRFLLWWFALDERGRFIYRGGMLRRMKGWGKDPFAATLCAIEFVGPCRFASFAADGAPVAVPHRSAWIQTAAVAKDQPLALDTRVRTPDGWKCVAGIRVGDRVFDERGDAQLVTRETEVMTGLDCHRVTFDDGQQVIASGGHGWTVERLRPHGDRHVVETLTTEQLAEGYLDSLGRRRIRIPVAGIESAAVDDLPVDPYILGLWLGDGNRNNGTIAIRWSLRDEIATILRPLLGPYEVLSFSHAGGDAGAVNIRNASRHATNGAALIERLRAAGLLRNKHVPDRYLCAGTEQRRALLQGLVDSDGGITRDGAVRFTNTNRRLVEGFVELARTLGYTPWVRARDNDAWIVQFRSDTRPLARLNAKRARQSDSPSPVGRYRYVVDVEQVESVPVKCIGVDTETHLFQVEGGILTHNTRNTMTLFPGMFSKRALAEYSIDLGKEIIYAHRGRCRIEAVTSSPRALEGGRPTFVLKNETQNWLESTDGPEMSAVIARNAAKSRDGSTRVLAIANAHNPGENSDAEADWEAWQRIDQGSSRAKGFLYDSLEAPADVRLADRESLMAGLLAARGDSEWVDPDRLIEEIYDPRTTPSTSRRFYLNQLVAAEDAYFAPHEWDQLAAPWWPVGGREITLGLDGSKTDDHTALVGCDVETGHEFTLGIWDPADYEGEEIPRPLVAAEVALARERWDVVGFYSDVHPFESYIDQWAEEFGEDLCVRATAHHPIGWDMRGRQQQATRASEALHDAVVESVSLLGSVEAEERWERLASGELPFTHDGDPALRQHALNARNRPNRWGMTFGKEHRSSSRKVDGLAGAMLARLCRMDYLALPASKRRQPRKRRGISVYIAGEER
jgi:hypothetical protein